MKPKKKPRGLRVRMRTCDCGRDCGLYIVTPERGWVISPVTLCSKWLHRAGLKPLKPGESRIVTVRIEDK